MSFKDTSSIILSDITLFSNYQMQGMYFYNPLIFEINNFECGEEADANYI